MNRRFKDSSPMLLLTVILSTLSVACKSAPSIEATSPLSAQRISTPTPPVSNVRRDEIPDLNEEYGIPYRNQYSNYMYAYSVELPQGLVGYSDPDPQPKHGIGITLSKQPKSYLWVDGSYNAAFLESLDAAINQHLEWLAEDGTDIEVLRREKTNLQELPAMRLVARYKSLATGEIRVQDLAVAFRPHEEDERGIKYTIGLIAPESRYNEDAAVLERIVTKWRVKPLPRA